MTMNWPFVMRSTYNHERVRLSEIYERSLEREHDRTNAMIARECDAYGELLRAYWRLKGEVELGRARR